MVSRVKKWYNRNRYTSKHHIEQKHNCTANQEGLINCAANFEDDYYHYVCWIYLACWGHMPSQIKPFIRMWQVGKKVNYFQEKIAEWRSCPSTFTPTQQSCTLKAWYMHRLLQCLIPVLSFWFPQICVCILWGFMDCGSSNYLDNSLPTYWILYANELPWGQAFVLSE